MTDTLDARLARAEGYLARLSMRRSATLLAAATSPRLVMCSTT